MSDKLSPELSKPSERDSLRVVFEHLFPGNNYANLGSFNPANLAYVFDRYMGIGLFNRGVSDIRLEDAILSNKEFASRVELGMMDKFALGFELSGLTPISEHPQDTSFKGNSFEDLVSIDKGEHLGGAASKRIPKERTTPSVWVINKIFGTKYYDKDLYVIGILDKDNKPAGLLHFKEGDGLKKREPQIQKVKTPTLVVNPTLT